MDSELYKAYICYAGPEAVKQEDGFIVLADAQTGLGKTFQASELELEHLISDSKRKLIYTTNLRVNVTEAYEELIEKVNANPSLSPSQKRQFLKNIILIPSQETSIKQLSEDDWQVLLGEVEGSQYRTISSLRDSIKILSQAAQSLSSYQLNDDLSERHNKLFKTLQTIFKDKFNQKKFSKSSAISRVLSKLFPASRIDDESTQVLFMTTAKLLYPWHALRKNYRLSDVLKNSLIIIDEFDRQQGEFLSHLLRGVKDFDVISLVRRLYSSFQSFLVQGDDEFDGVEDSFIKFREQLAEFDASWQVSLRPYINDKTIQAGVENQNRVFTMLSDRMSLHTINFKHDELMSDIDEFRGAHEIGTGGERSAITFINHASQVVRAFCNAMLGATNKLSNNLRSIEGSKPHSTEDLITKVLNHFGLAELRNDVLSLLSARLSYRVQKDYKSYSYHDAGFEISKISKFSELDNTATAATFELALTPTGLLANWVLEGAKILGISATATSPTAIHNFDLPYLQNVLGDKFKHLSELQKQSIQQEYLSKRRYKEQKIHIDVQAVSEKDLRGGVELLYKEFRGGYVDDLMLESQLIQLLGANSKSIVFSKSRVNKLIAAIKRFAIHPSNRYMFCMLNNSYKGHEFFRFMEFVGKKYGVRIFENINAASFRNEQFNSVLGLLEDTNEKVVVITNYQATGAGLSPSYSIKNKRDFVYIGPEGKPPFQNKTDIDAIYIEQPKSLIGSFIYDDQPLDERSFSIKKNIHDTLMLHEKGVLVANDVKPILSKFIATNVKGMSVSSLISIYKDTDDYRHAVFRFIEQALGRMCRTEWKQREISIMFDGDIEFVETLASDNRDLSYLSVEYATLISKVKSECKIDATNKLAHSYSAKASRNHSHIQRLITRVYRHQSRDAVGQYARLRQSVLEQPTASQIPTGESNRYYIQSNTPGSYRYHIDYKDENGVTQVFINSQDYATQKIVSATSARLDKLMLNNVVKSHFIENGFATSFGEHEYIIAPAMFDIYMGALGEETVFAILNDFGFQVEKMPDGTVEWFDGYLELGDRVLLIDVKHWDVEKSCLQRDDTLEKCKTKLENLKREVPAAFKGKQVQAMYINVSYEKGSTITGSNFSNDSELLVESANLLQADVIDVPGIIDIHTGQSNIPPMEQLLTLLETMKGLN
ncbi:hypothetical protein [Pseudoalteromonas sp. P1-8]|uniref:hypothetical protein n=1 Tax=Pseudoalteromonas sp. P1-8 TaxID=1710353 RepID=UPI0006DCB478|nr:hypothetical protein [Pseudoalteromonas sp. P1-8]KPW01975.1 hypothetical protein AN213_01431 [Pseudoalteromonas sp. P1-8]